MSYPKWTAFINPLFITIIFICGLAVLPEVFVYLAPGSINKGNVLFFLIPAILLWNGDKSSSTEVCQRGRFLMTH